MKEAIVFREGSRDYHESFLNSTTHLKPIVGARGNVPCPAIGDQSDSNIIWARRRKVLLLEIVIILEALWVLGLIWLVST